MTELPSLLHIELERITAELADELLRLPCRVDHDKEPCKKCDGLARWNCYCQIVQRQIPNKETT